MDLREVFWGGPHKDIEAEVDPLLEAASISASDQIMPWIARAKEPQNLGLISMSLGLLSRGSILNSTMATPYQSSAFSNESAIS